MSEEETTAWLEALRRLPASPTSGEESLRRRLLEVLLTPAEPHKAARHPVMRYEMTYEEFLAWADEDTLAEWVDGEAVMYSPASKRHQNIADFLLKVMGTYIESHDLGMAISAPF